MQALRQKCRPKHQVLILKCYPKLPKTTAANAQEAKPNGSELSYLLYYASSRRAKLTKVGSFLERRTAADVYKGRMAAVHVTLEILTAFLNSTNIASVDAFPLLAPHVLRILQEVLGHANDVAVVEACLPVWDAFCRDQDHATLAADAEYRDLFADVVKRWAGYADKTTKYAGGPSDNIKLRKAGLEAVRSIAAAQALASDPGHQIPVIIPVVLRNLYSQDASYLATLDTRQNEERQAEQSKVRPSMSTVRTTRTDEGDARAAGGTAQDADRYAEEEAGILALRCFKTLFDVDNRSQVRMATTSMLDFIAQNSTNQAWAISLVKLACNCTPVQDRFVVLFTAVETLIRNPIVEDTLLKQLALASIVEQVLGSNINLIGLSVMDILLGLVQHVLLVLQLGTTQSSMEEKSPKEPVMEVVKSPSPTRVQLLAHLRQCIVNLAIHVYYTDQISDMVSAILLRLKPSASATQNPVATANAIEDPTATANDSANSSGLRERPNTDGFFSFDTAREVALDAVKQILIIANKDNPTANSSVKTHNPVPIGVWEGTQWLLRDSYLPVRVGYVDALCVWLDLETRDNDSRVEEKTTSDKQKRDKANGNNMARRAVSNASARSKASRKGRSTFLQLLHLAIYEDALQRAELPDSDAEFLVLHLLLSSLCAKLGINAARTGVPMMFRLQEDIQTISTPKAKVRIGALVHGYLWSLAHIFNFETGVVGTEIQSEVARRQKIRIWIHGLQVPALSITQIPTVTGNDAPKLPASTVEEEVLRPFDHRQQLVERIADSYTSSLVSPPTTPGSPSRSFSLPSLADASGFLSTGKPRPSLPPAYTEELLADWTKEDLLASIAASAPKSISLSGSRTGTASAHPSAANLVALGEHRRLLAAANTFPYASPRSTSESFNLNRTGTFGRTGTAHSHRLVSGSPGRQRRQSGSTSGRGDSGRGDAASSVTNSGATRIEELKRVLAGQATPSHRGDVEDSSESLVEVGDDDESGYGTPLRTGSREDQTPTLKLNGDVAQSGSGVGNGGNGLGVVGIGSDRGRREDIRPGSRRIASRSSNRGFGGTGAGVSKRDLRDLLSEIDDGGEADGDHGSEGGGGLKVPY